MRDNNNKNTIRVQPSSSPCTQYARLNVSVSGCFYPKRQMLLVEWISSKLNSGANVYRRWLRSPTYDCLLLFALPLFFFSSRCTILLLFFMLPKQRQLPIHYSICCHSRFSFVLGRRWFLLFNVFPNTGPHNQPQLVVSLRYFFHSRALSPPRIIFPYRSTCTPVAIQPKQQHWDAQSISPFRVGDANSFVCALYSPSPFTYPPFFGQTLARFDKNRFIGAKERILTS